ncbi:MAG: efflux RND transporter periplasmic adaptor subunit [Opitutaceae bacterium]|nr:efflux RND transporter periplasmic adaptor subunit [Opitutaceae bacterium]
MITSPSLPHRSCNCWIWPGLLLIGTVLAGCSDGAKSNDRSARSIGPAPVVVAKVQRKVVPLALDAIGAVEPIRTAAVRSQVSGILLRLAFREGQDVQQGDLLFEIDPRPLENSLRSAEAELQKTRVQLETAHAAVVRYRGLNEQGMVSKEQFESIQDNERSLQAAVHASEAAVENDRLQLAYCSIQAPISGRTGSLGVHEGDLVGASDPAGALVVINQLSPIYVTFSVPQQNLAALNRRRAADGIPVLASPPGGNKQPEQGELTFIDNMIDSATGTLKLKATFPNLNHRLWPGQFTNVRLILSAPEVLVVPQAAVQTDQNNQHVFVVRPDRTAEFRAVVVKRTFEGEAVVSSGLTEGETVVVDGQLRVVAGGKVEIKQPPPPPAPAPSAAKSR